LPDEVRRLVTDRVQLEQALMAIDIFPRCALLLTVFERLSLEDASVLLDAKEDLSRTGQVIGLRELIKNLAEVPTSIAESGISQLPRLPEMQPAT
jgi:hypothetical protein